MDRLRGLKDFVRSKGWRWEPGKPIPYGEQIVVRHGSDSVTVNYYPKSHKMVPGGSASPLKSALEGWIGVPATTRSATTAPVKGTAKGAASAAYDSVPHIGMDESGKGDWFGPLVVAAVYVTPEEAEALRNAGVQDSKMLLLSQVTAAAAKIRKLLPDPHYHVRVVMPEEYNRRYALTPNLNRLLAEVYAEAAEPVWEATSTGTILCDQFAKSADRLNEAFRRYGLPKPSQQTHAESASIAVAAASVLATDAFRVSLVELGQEAGLSGPLPKGASDVRALKGAVKSILGREGEAGLARYAKLHFKPVRAILNPGLF